MDKAKLEEKCRELLPNCVVFLNPLKNGNSPENDQEYDSIVMYAPKFFDQKRIPTHINIQNAFRVCFVDGDWLELGKDIFITRRTINDKRLSILYSMNYLDELKQIEFNIDKLMYFLNAKYKKNENIRLKIKVKEPKLFIGSNKGICVLSFPRIDDDHLIFGLLESLRSFNQEIVLRNIMNDSLENINSINETNEVKISNKILEIDSSIPLDNNLNFSIFHFNPDDIYDEINKRTIDELKVFLRATLRRNNLLNKEFRHHINIYQNAFRNPIFGNVSAEQILYRVQNFGDEILFFPLLSETFRELTKALDFSSNCELFLLNSLDANIVAIDSNHSMINTDNLIELNKDFIEKFDLYRSKINRVISSKVINSAILEFGLKKCRIFPIEGLTRFNNYEIGPSIIEVHFSFTGNWEEISEIRDKNKILINSLEHGIIQLSDPIHVRPNINENGIRTTRIVKINEKIIKMPDFSFLNSDKRKELRLFIRENISEVINTPLLTMLKIIKFAKENLELKSK